MRMGAMLAWCGLTAVALAAAAGDAAPGLRAARMDKIQGVTISTHRIGLEWGTDVIAPTLDHIVTVGANWVSIHPYAMVGRDGSVRWDRFDPREYAESIARPIREAHGRGLKIFVKPHLAYWGSGFSWRGDIAYDDVESRRRFFREYKAWIVAVAAMAKDADALSVGCELERLSHLDEQWRDIIEGVRARTDAHLTYSANWTEYLHVPFWDALDAVGIQAYFPIADDGLPTDDGLRAGWARRMEEMRAISRRTGRIVVFTELGYNRSENAAREPWKDDVDTSSAAQLLQERCLRVALEAIAAEPSVVGAFLWKWFPEPHPTGRNFALATAELKDVICARWCRAQ